MKHNTLEKFVTLRRYFTEEKRSLENRLRQINEALGESVPAANEAAAPIALPATGGKRTMSPEARARIAAAQRARWSATRKGQPKPAPVQASSDGKPKRKMSAAGRRAIAEAARRRWAAAKAAGKSTL